MVWLCAWFFVIWLVLTITNQFETVFSHRLRKLDVFGLIPVWRFFAPRPGIHDHYILIQDCDADGHLLEWRQLVGPSARRFESFIWNPGKWENKAVADLVQLIAQVIQVDGMDRRALMLTSPYLIILHFVLDQPFDCSVVARRFALVRKMGRSGHLELAMASEFHPPLVS